VVGAAALAPSALDERVVEDPGVVVLARDDHDLVPDARMQHALVVELGSEVVV
jgi:hypothetical protein